MKYSTLLTVALVSLALLPLAVHAQVDRNVPSFIDYQGLVLDNNGAPLAPPAAGNVPDPKNYEMYFRIWDEQIGGKLIWAEKQIVTVDNGTFSVQLGAGVAITTADSEVPISGSQDPKVDLKTVFDDSDRYLGVWVAPNFVDNPIAEIVPRLRFLSSPFSMVAERAKVADRITANGTGSSTLSDATVTGVLNTGGNVGIGVASPTSSLEIAKANSIGANDGQGMLSIGSNAGVHIALDENEIQAYSGNTSNSTLGLNPYGGNLTLGDTSSTVSIPGNILVTDFLSVDGFTYLDGFESIGAGSITGTLAVSQTLDVNGGLDVDGFTDLDGFNSVGTSTVSNGASGQTEHSAADFRVEDDQDCYIQINSPIQAGIFFGRGTTPSAFSASHGAVIYNSSGDMEFRTGGSQKMTIEANGNVGIGTATPTRGKLEIAGVGGSKVPIVNANYLNSNGHTAAGLFDGDLNLSLYCSGVAVVEAVFLQSDARIKRDQTQSDSRADLRTLLGIEVTDYRYIDTVAHGTRAQKKVIAQQVEKVFPVAVSKSTDEVPDIYKQATFADGWVQLETDLKEGERVRLMGEKEEGIHEVLEVREGAFRTDFKPATEKVFVFGREVDDFRTVDYDAISMLNVSATQELHRRLEKQDSELAAKTTQISSLEQRLAALEKRDKERDATLAKLERLLDTDLKVQPVSIELGSAQ